MSTFSGAFSLLASTELVTTLQRGNDRPSNGARGTDDVAMRMTIQGASLTQGSGTLLTQVTVCRARDGTRADTARAMSSASRPTPWIIVDDIAY